MSKSHMSRAPITVSSNPGQPALRPETCASALRRLHELLSLARIPVAPSGVYP